MTKDRTLYAWCDVETDGLGRDTNLLEIAVIITDPQMNVLDEKGYHAVIKYNKAQSSDMYKNATPFVQEMHSTSGLWDRLHSTESKTKQDVDNELYGYLKKFTPNPREILLGGNSLRLDLNMVEWHLPKTYSHLHYRMVDVSTLAEVAQQWYGIICPEKELRHEAMSDIRETIQQARFLRSRLQLNSKFQ